MKKDTIKKVLTGMFDVIESDQIELFQSLIDKKCYEDIKTLDQFYFSLIYPFQEYLAGLIRTEICDDSDIVFIVQNSQFIKSHFEKLISQIEGRPCCADKSSTIADRLVRFFKTGKEIEFDFSQKYTFHLPKTVFKTHESIVEFYNGLKQLYYGNNEKYLKALLNVKKQVV